MRRRAALPLAVTLGAALLASSGCTQVAQLRGVAGAELSAVRTATNDVLVSKGVAIRVAPVCEYDATTYACEGTAADGSVIASTAIVRAAYGATTDEWGADAPADISLVVTVAGTSIYDGTVEEVLQSSGQATP